MSAFQAFDRKERWQPVQGTFARNFLSDVAPAVPRIPKLFPNGIQLPQGVEQIISAISNRHIKNGAVDLSSVHEVQQICIHEGVPDYTKHSGPFFNAYFVTNALKALRVIASEPLLCESETIRILDLGSGSGATTLGTICALLSRPNPPKQIFVELIESSPEQNVLSNEVLSACIAELCFPVSFRIVQADVVDAMRSINHRIHTENQPQSEDQYDIVMSSYLLTEMIGSKAAELCVELQFLVMNTTIPPPALLFMGSYAPGNHFGYYLHDPKRGEPAFGAAEVILKAFGLQEMTSVLSAG